MDSLEGRAIAGTEGADQPFLSPDGQWVGFFAGGKLKKVPVTGGAALTLADAGLPRGATWGPNDNIIFTPADNSGLSVVSAAGGNSQIVTKLDSSNGEFTHRWPAFLPGGKAVLFTAGSAVNYDNAQIVVQNLETGERRALIQGGTYPRYVPTGHIVYYRAGTVMAVPFDLQRLEVTGPAIPVVEGVRSTGVTGAAQYAMSDVGSLFYVPGLGGQEIKRTLVWVDRKGMVQPLRAPQRGYVYPRLSPDGQRVALMTQEANVDIWVYDLARDTLTRLTFDLTVDETPAWSPDGKNLAFAHQAAATTIIQIPADGSGTAETLATIPEHTHISFWSPNSQMLAVEQQRPGTGLDIWILQLEGDPSAGLGQGRKPKPFLQTSFNEISGAFSPDGRWLAYRSDESGRNEVYVQPYPGPGGKWQISTEGGTEPVWARNGRELFYRNGDKMMAVEITTQPAFTASTPKVLFEGQFGTADSLLSAPTNYDVSPDGQRFLMIKASEEQPSPTQINVVLDWFEELKRRVPAGQ
jgi:serine/threonine-protein kinase